MNAVKMSRQKYKGRLFSKGLKQSLSSICRFIPYSALKKEIEFYGPKIKRLPPDFLDDIAESF